MPNNGLMTLTSLLSAHASLLSFKPTCTTICERKCFLLDVNHTYPSYSTCPKPSPSFSPPSLPYSLLGWNSMPSTYMLKARILTVFVYVCMCVCVCEDSKGKCTKSLLACMQEGLNISPYLYFLLSRENFLLNPLNI